MIERVVVLPVRDNDGKRLDYWLGKVRAEVLAIAGGYSESKQVGAWRDDDGTVYKDASVRLSTLVDTEQDAEIEARLPVWCGWLRQICLLTTRAEVVVSFVEAVRVEAVAGVGA